VHELHLAHDSELGYERRPDLEWVQLLQRPALLSLQLLDASDRYVPNDALRLVAQLPRLRSLSMGHDADSDVVLLAASPSLTHISLDVHDGLPWSLRMLERLDRLRSIRLCGVSEPTFDFSELFTAPPLP